MAEWTLMIALTIVVIACLRPRNTPVIHVHVVFVHKDEVIEGEEWKTGVEEE